MTNIPIADTGRRMGKPPLKKDHATRATTVRLTEDIYARIDAVAGPNRMSKFIREAVEAELERREKDQAE